MLPVSERERAKEPASKKFEVLDENSEILDNLGGGFSLWTEIREWECDALMGLEEEEGEWQILRNVRDEGR